MDTADMTACDLRRSAVVAAPATNRRGRVRAWAGFGRNLGPVPIVGSFIVEQIEYGF